jgi:hypothetical protein
VLAASIIREIPLSMKSVHFKKKAFSSKSASLDYFVTSHGWLVSVNPFKHRAHINNSQFKNSVPTQNKTQSFHFYISWLMLFKK